MEFVSYVQRGHWICFLPGHPNILCRSPMASNTWELQNDVFTHKWNILKRKLRIFHNIDSLTVLINLRWFVFNLLYHHVKRMHGNVLEDNDNFIWGGILFSKKNCFLWGTLLSVGKCLEEGGGVMIMRFWRGIITRLRMLLCASFNSIRLLLFIFRIF